MEQKKRKRIVTKIGDVFCAEFADEGYKMYFQYIASDMTQLNSSVIRVFETRYPLTAAPKLVEVVRDRVMFYSHVVLRWGIEMGLWSKVGKVPFDEDIPVVFGGYIDNTSLEIYPPGYFPTQWRVWRVNTEWVYVSSFAEVGQKVEYGGVMPPDAIVNRMKTGEYQWSILGFTHFE